jgi:raffinose/stachyose/melibiose transport system permease protein
MKSFRSSKVAVFIFVFPALAIFSTIVVYPLARTLFMSFFQWDGLASLSETKFIFLDNFKNLFRDEIFYTSFVNGLIFAVVLTGFQLFFATIFSLTLLEKKLPGRNILRRGYFMPVVLSITVVCQLWLSMYNPTYGLFNKIFEFLGFSYRQEWLSSMGKTSIIAVAMVSSWQYMGYQLALIYAGAKSIPEHYFEAAKIDGATTVQTHIKVTLPLLAETYRICFIFCINAGLNAFAQMQIMTKGGPGTATYSLSYFMYRSAFLLNEYGYGCAIAVVLVAQCLLVTVLLNRYIARERITY